MLIRFNVKNFRSFQDEATLSMIPSASEDHPHHVYRDNDNGGFSTSRIASVYGKNASGKSNLIKAMDFAQKMIVKGRTHGSKIRRQSFRLDDDTRKSPTKFEFEFATKGIGYAYGFTVTNERVVTEWLYEITLEKDIKLFERTTSENGETEIEFEFKNISNGQLNSEGEGRLKFAGKNTPKNQLFLTASLGNNILYFSDVYNWFNEVLVVVYPQSKSNEVGIRIHREDIFREKLSLFMSDMDTGIDEVLYHKLEQASLPLPSDILDEIQNDLVQNEQEAVGLQLFSERYIISLDEDGQLEFQVLGTRREKKKGGSEYFGFEDESDGTRRLLDLFPIFYSQDEKVFVIDELERSLHPILVKELLQWFLRNNSKSQIIFTTHDATLLKRKLLRRDSYWFTEKSKAGASILYSLEDFDFTERPDLKYGKGYLNGRFGAIPVFGNSLFQQQEVENGRAQ